MLKYFIAEQTFLNVYISMKDTTHIPSTTTRTKLYLSIEDFKSHFMGTYIFFSRS